MARVGVLWCLPHPVCPGCARHPPALPWACSGSEPLGMSLFGPFSPAGAAPPPRFALKRSEPARLCLLGASCLSLGSRGKVEVRFSTLGVAGSARLWEKPPRGVLAAERAACLGTGRALGVQGAGRAPGGIRDTGSTRLARARKGSQRDLWHGGLRASACGSHRPPGCPMSPSRTHLEGWIGIGRQRKGSGLAGGC